MPLADQIINAESGGETNATNPNSSATGPGQFINSTWLDLIGKYRPDLAQGKSPAQILALRSDPDVSSQMVRAYANENTNILGNAGLPATAGNLYLAHFAGPGGAVNVLKADPSTPVSQILSPQAVAANPFLKGMNAGQLAQWAGGRVGGQQKAQPMNPDDQSQPLNIAPPAQVAAAQAMPQGGLMGILAPMLARGQLPTPQGGALGFLNGSNPSAATQPMNAQAPMPSVAASPAAPTMQLPQLPNGTPAAQMMRAALLASLMRSPGAQPI